ncbi:GPR1/FUN34/YaaH family transporter [Halegenticoccus tardaugens]|uniref:GPR1/FUN34/YaaH family transporter n=1 Tax=Halegenticoccus tardaugens TaxID=2071624 RepID=UPI00100A6676|nr:GPR1/FUN34/YaaH family transporter [Halegenticoccus tardaugens]
MSDQETHPSIFALLLFGYSLAVLGVELLVTTQAVGALMFAILIAGIGESIGGIWELSKGETLIGTTMATFGIWLIGLFLLETLGQVLDLLSPISLGTYFLVLLIPIAILAVPPFKNRMAIPIRGAFAALFLLVLFAGAEFILETGILGPIAGVFAWVAALFIWILAIEDVLEIGHTPVKSAEPVIEPEDSDPT